MRRLSMFVCAAAICAASAGLSQTAQDRTETLKYLHGLQAPRGGYYGATPKAGTQPEPSLSATTSTLRAIKYFGGTPKDAPAHTRFVESCHDAASGGFADQPGEKPSVATTASAIMAAAELGLPLDKYAAGALRYLGANAKQFEEIRIAAAAVEILKARPPQAMEWLREIAKQRKSDGTYGDGDGAARATGGTVPLVLRLGGTVENRDAVVRVLKNGQRSDGGYGPADKPGSDLGSTYRVMRCFMMLKAQPDDPVKLRTFVATCRNQDGGYGVTPDAPSTASGTYFAGIILHWLDAR